MPSPYQGSPLEGLADSVPALGLALVVGRSRVGKTAFLAHVAMEAILAGEQVLHVEVRDPAAFVYTHYNELRRMLGDQFPGESLAVRVERQRRVHTGPFDLVRLRAHLDMLALVEEFRPSRILVDGLSEAEGSHELMAALAELAAERSLLCWAAVDSEAPVATAVFNKAALVLRLVPTDTTPVRVHLRRVHGPESGGPPALLDATTLFVVEPTTAQVALASGCTLYTGGAAGSEVAFGEAASRHGVREVAFTFDGHLQERTVGRQELSPRELAMGDVSLGYVSKRLNRSYNDRGGLIRGVLQTLWHMVSRSDQVFVIGEIMADGTVRGGTGWGVELARMWGRELWVFDQPRASWHQWNGESWDEGSPRITAGSICGTGTRKLGDAGRAAIEDLFSTSFSE